MPDGRRPTSSSPTTPDCARHAAAIAESRRHSLRRRAGREGAGEPVDGPAATAGDEAEQLSMFSVIGSVATEAADGGDGVGVFGEDPDDPSGIAGGPSRREPDGVELLLHPPPLPSGRAAVVTDAGPGGGSASPVVPLRERKAAVRQANADLAVELVRATGWGHAAGEPRAEPARGHRAHRRGHAGPTRASARRGPALVAPDLIAAARWPTDPAGGPPGRPVGAHRPAGASHGRCGQSCLGYRPRISARTWA